MPLRVYEYVPNERASAWERMKSTETVLGGFVFGEDEKNASGKLYRKYYACDDLETYFNRVRSLAPMRRRSHETFNASLRCRLFLDFDCVGEKPETVLENVHRVMALLGSKRFVLVDGTRETKVSFHVVSHDVVLVDADAVRRYVETVLDSNSIDRAEMGIDLDPCGNWKSLRTIYSKGFDKPTWLRLHGKSHDELSFDDFVSATVQTRDPPNTVAPEPVRRVFVSAYDETTESLKQRARDVLQNWLLMKHDDVKIKRASTYESPNTVALYVYNTPCPFLRDHVHHSNRVLLTCFLFDAAILARTDFVFSPTIRITFGCFNKDCGENREKISVDAETVRAIQAEIYS